MRVIVYHGTYGCDTGCCGHWVEMGDKSQFEFSHPWSDDWKSGPTPEEIKTFVIDMVTESFGAEHVADIDWDECLVIDD